VTDKRAVATRNDDPTAVRLLPLYRRRLNELLRAADEAAPGEPAALCVAIGRVVADLNADLVGLYRRSEAGVLRRFDQGIVLPALERLRDVLRRRSMQIRPIRDTLRKAISELRRTA
jgi:hypothetical protein